MRSRTRWTLRVALLVLLLGLVPSVAFADNCSGQRDCFASMAAAAAAAAAAGALAGAAAGTMGAAVGAANRGRQAEAYQAGWKDGRAYWRRAESWRGYVGRESIIVPDQYSGRAGADYMNGFTHGIRSLPGLTHGDAMMYMYKGYQRASEWLGGEEKGSSLCGGGKG
jgi:hypothetical protein